MTAQKPPDKTLVGMPADLKAVLEKLDQATADKSAFSDPPRGSAFDPSHARPAEPPAQKPRSVPPPLRPTAGSTPPPLPAHRASDSSPDPTAPAAMDRTLIGMPTHMQEALSRAIEAEQAKAASVAAPPPVVPPEPAPAPRTPPSAAGPALRAQPVRAIGGPSAPVSEPQVPMMSGRGPVPAPKPTAAASYQAVPPRAAPTYASGLGYQGASYHDPSRPQGEPAHGEQAGMKVLAPQAPLDWPPAARRSDPSLAPVRADEATPEHDAAVLGTEPTQLALNAEVPLDGSTADAAAYEPVHSPRLALPDFEPSRKTHRTHKPRKRWIALVAGGLGLAALGALGAWLAPKLLSGAPAADPGDAPPALVEAPTLPVVPAATVTDTAAATDPGRFTPTPTRPPAAPAMTSGSSAQLEKQAIERLVANDYPAAKQLYEKLRSAEPSRPEFALMLELLGRAAARPCGQPGQVPCVGAQP